MNSNKELFLFLCDYSNARLDENNMATLNNECLADISNLSNLKLQRVTVNCGLRFAVSREEHEFNFERNLLDHLSVITQLLVAVIGSMFDFIPGLCIQQTAVFFSAQSLIPGKHKNPKSW